MSSLDWKCKVQTFSDKNLQVYTVINLRPELSAPRGADPNFIENKTYRNLLRPQYSFREVPEAPFLLRHDTPTDPLLAHLFSSEDIFAPRQFAKGWGMTAETRDSWVQLEKGLSHIANLLVSLHNGLLAWEIHDAPWWKTPEECGYRRLYKYKEHARWAIERSREALMVLAARCSLAIALWMPWTERAGTVPSWFKFLVEQRIPRTWVETLHQSIIADFSMDLRIGAFFDFDNCRWPSLALTLAGAQVPAFFIWKNKQYEEEWCKRLDWLNGYLPKGTDPNRARLSKPPCYFPNVYNFWRTGEWHVQPDMFTFTEDGNPPVGPFQLPGESREQFLQWAKSYHPPPFWDSIDARRRRQQRIERHNPENFPEPRALVYIWIPIWLSFPNIPIKWRQLEYRMPVPPRSRRAVWNMTSPKTRYYNGHFDTWDVWTEQPPIPPRSAFDHIGNLMDVENDIKAIVELEPISNQLEGAEYMIEQSFEADNTFLNSGGPLSKFRITFTPTYLQDRFGLHPSARTFPKLNYESKDVRKQIKFVAKTLGTFGSINVPQELHCAYGAWVHTILNTEWKKLNAADFPDAVQECWDLDRRSPHYLLQPNILHEVNLQAVDTVDSTRVYVITYDRDEGAQNWHLIVNPTVTAYLLRQLAHIKTAKVAANHLANIGAPFYTAGGPVVDVHTYQHGSTRLLPQYLPMNARMTPAEYSQYQQRVLSLLDSRPHARAAFKMGGIVWHIAMETIGDHDSLLIKMYEQVHMGPTQNPATHTRVIQTANANDDSWDDALSEDELDIICGVCKVWTQNKQTEDASWWPRHAQWLRGGCSTTFWTAWNEEWFQTRLKEIKDGKKAMRNGREWKKSLDQHMDTHRLDAALMTATEQAIQRAFTT